MEHISRAPNGGIGNSRAVRGRGLSVWSRTGLGNCCGEMGFHEQRESNRKGDDSMMGKPKGRSAIGRRLLVVSACLVVPFLVAGMLPGCTRTQTRVVVEETATTSATTKAPETTSTSTPMSTRTPQTTATTRVRRARVRRIRPKLAIVEPQNNEMVRAQHVTVAVKVSHIRLVRRGARKHGEGMLRYKLGSRIFQTDRTTWTFTDVPNGFHKVSVQVVHRDGASFDPPIFKEIMVQVAYPYQ